MAREDIPRVLAIRPSPAFVSVGPSYYTITISKHQYRKLAPWLNDTLRFWDDGDNPRRVWVRIQAKDELEAIMRFRKLWVGLPKKEQE